MSYLSTLVGTSAAAAVPRSVEPPVEQHVEVDTTAATREAAAVPITASVADAMRAAFEWVAPRAESPALAPAAAETPLQAGGVSLEIRADRQAAPMETAEFLETARASDPTAFLRPEHPLPPLAAPRSSSHSSAQNGTGLHMLSTLSALSALSGLSGLSETVELAAFEPATPFALEAHRSTTAPAQSRPAREAAAPAEAAVKSGSIQVHIGSISLDIRTPPPPTPPAAPAQPLLAATPAARPARSAPFAFSARRHHLRWG